MPVLDKYLTPNTDYFVGIVVQSGGKFVFGSQVSGWLKNAAGKYEVPFDLVSFKVKRDETIIESVKRLCKEELGAEVILTDMKNGQTGVMTDLTFLFEQIEGEEIPPAYISIRKKATSSKINAEAYSNNFVYSGKTNAKTFKSMNMQALFKTPPALLRKIMSNTLSLGQALDEGLEIADTKIQIPEDSIFIAQNNLVEFMRFLKEAMK